MKFPFVSRRTFETALASQIAEKRILADNLSEVENILDRERTQRIAAETLSVERRQEVERLRGELIDMREEVKHVTTLHLKSVDAVNLKLMQPRAEEVPPDMEKFKQAAEARATVVTQAVRRIRDMHQAVDNAVIAKLHPKFAGLGKVAPEPASPQGVVMNVPQEVK